MKPWKSIILLAILLSACSQTAPAPVTTPTVPNLEEPSPTATPTETPIPPTDTPTPTASLTPTLEPQDYGPDNFPENVNPLTGLPVPKPELLDRRPVAVKIQTFPRGQRPPWAISLADIVYDYYQNNGLTRLHAIYYTNNAEQVGPIRSARLPDGTLVRMYESIFAFGGADRRILNRLFNTEYANRLIVEGSNICPAMCRIEPNTYNYLVANTAELGLYAERQGADNTRQNLDGMSFQHQAPTGGNPGEQVSVRYSISSYSRWDYDLESGRYLRFQDAQEDSGQGEAYEPFMDRTTEEQVTADNVVVLFAEHEYVRRQGNNEIVDIKLSGEGQAYLFRDGQAYKVNWNAVPNESILHLTDVEGNPVAFKPGTTWFQVIGETSLNNQEQNEQGTWRFEFRIP